MNLGAPLRFLYENGKAFGFLVDEATAYFYIKNLHGDVVQIVDESGNTMVTYSYDSWGNELSATGDETLLALNPFTYRGYQYDRETGLYYLQARYYNPQWGRFINADTNMDTQTSVIGTNIFAYCDNNPVMHTDTRGKGIDLSTLTEEQGSRLFANLLQFLAGVPKLGSITDIRLDVDMMIITAAMSRFLETTVEIAISLIFSVIAGVAMAFVATAVGIVAAFGKMITASGLLGVTAKDFVVGYMDRLMEDMNLNFNIFSNVTPGEYIYGTITIKDTVNNGFTITEYLHIYSFIYGPKGTSLDYFYYERVEGGTVFV